MKTVTQKVLGFLYKTCLANPGGIPSPTTIQRAFAVGTPTEDLTAATFEPDKEQQPEGFLIIPLTSGDIKVHLAGAPAFEDYTISGVEVDASLGVPMLCIVALVDFVVLVIRVLEIVLPSPRFRNIKMASYLMEKPLILKI